MHMSELRERCGAKEREDAGCGACPIIWSWLGACAIISNARSLHSGAFGSADVGLESTDIDRVRGPVSDIESVCPPVSMLGAAVAAQRQV